MDKQLQDFQLKSYQFDLPPAQVAQFPPSLRGDSRLLVMGRRPGAPLTHTAFSQLPDYLPPNALLVANNSRVLQARLMGLRPSGGKVEFLLLTPLPLLLNEAHPVGRDTPQHFAAEASGLIRAGGHVNEGDTFTFGGGLSVTVITRGSFGQHRVRLCWKVFV